MMLASQDNTLIEELPQSSSETTMQHGKKYSVASSKTNLNYDIVIQDETTSSNQRCYILTVHDFNHDYTRFQEFVMVADMVSIRNRAIWIHVSMPGLSQYCPDLSVRKYPSLEEMGADLVCVLDYLKVSQVVCMGEGSGANVATYFALSNPYRCFGLILLEPIGSSGGIIESLRQKLAPKGFSPGNSRSNSLSLSENQSILKNEVTATDQAEVGKQTPERRNSKNLSLFADSFTNRGCLSEKLKSLTVDALIAVGKESPVYNETKRFYKTLQDSRKRTPEKMVNCPYIEVDNVKNVMDECSDRLAVSMQYFLQGIGLLSAIPMKVSLKGMANYGRSISMEEADRPRSNSESSPSIAVSSSPSISNSED